MKKILRHGLILLVLTAIIVTVAGCGGGKYDGASSQTAVPGSAEVASQWMDLIIHLFEKEAITPPQSSRMSAYAGVSLYEAALPGMTGYTTLSGQLNDMPAMPQPEAGKQYDWHISVTAAMATTTKGLFTLASETTIQAISDLENAQLESQGADVADDVVQRSVAFGAAVGNAVLGWADQDGYQATRGLSYTPPAGTGMWEQTPPGYKPPLEPYWGQLRTFVLPSVDSCVPAAPVPYSTDPGSAFYQQALAVYQAKNNMKDSQRTIANFWADNAGQSFTPPGHWVSIMNQVVTQLDLSLAQTAEMYALAGVSMGDAFISCWHAKYQYCVPRPVTYINQIIDPEWQPELVTPPFPEYTSGHSTVSGAASTVLSGLLGKVTFTDKSYEDRGVLSRTYSSFEEAAQEAAVSRLYGGIHYPLTNQNGVSQGQLIGQMVLDSIQTRTGK